MTPSTVMSATAVDHSLERRALERMVDGHQHRLYGVALSILRDAGDAEDAVQETFLAAWRNWTAIRDEDKRNAWLTTIRVRQCIRRKRRLRHWLLGERSADTAAPVHPRFQGRLLDLDRAQNKLSRRQRAVLVLCYYHGYSADQCGELMGMSPGTVRSHLARALANLRKEMTDA